MNRKPRLVITPGEPAGVGPDVLIQAVQQPVPAELVAIADPDLLQERAMRLGLPLKITIVSELSSLPEQNPSELFVMPVTMDVACKPGNPQLANANYILNTLGYAIEKCVYGWADGLVTGPVNKGDISRAGYEFTGHTEYLAAQCDASVVMLLVAESLRVAVLTRHIPLRAVANAITAPKLAAALRLLHATLAEQFQIEQPRIAVCGLNPHAGDQGHLGREEIDIIEPVIGELQRQGMHLEGPLSADSVFVKSRREQFDAILAMYHDQGLAPLKAVGFGGAVNVTLGLPFVRTSVDHGTAYELAGTGRADPGSMLAAIRLAAQLSTQ